MGETGLGQPQDRDAAKWLDRKRNVGGTVYEYNDVRVNALALAALNVWRKPLPQVLKENVMDEMGAPSNSWRWFGYENSFVVIDGTIIQSVAAADTGAEECLFQHAISPALDCSHRETANGAINRSFRRNS